MNSKVLKKEFSYVLLHAVGDPWTVVDLTSPEIEAKAYSKRKKCVIRVIGKSPEDCVQKLLQAVGRKKPNFFVEFFKAVGYYR